MNKYYLTESDIDKFGKNVAIYVQNMITDKHHATKIDYDSGLCYDKFIRAWKPPFFDFHDLAEAVLYGAKLMQDTLIDREQKQLNNTKPSAEKEENTNKQYKRKTCAYGTNQIMENIISKHIGKETLTIDEIAEVIETLFGE